MEHLAHASASDFNREIAGNCTIVCIIFKQFRSLFVYRTRVLFLLMCPTLVFSLTLDFQYVPQKVEEYLLF